MKSLVTLALIHLFSCASVFAEDLFATRNWTSAEGVAISATLIEASDKSVKLKNAKGGKTFDVDLKKLSRGDLDLIDATIEKIDETIEAKAFGTPAELNEKDLANAFRLGKHSALWTAAVEAGARLNMTPQRIERETDVHVIIIGEHVSIRLQMNQNYNKFTISGDNLDKQSKSGNSKTHIATRKAPFTPKVATLNQYMVSLKFEDINLSYMPVIGCKHDDYYLLSR